MFSKRLLARMMLLAACALLDAGAIQAQSYAVLTSFPALLCCPITPSRVVQGSDGDFYGTTGHGGIHGYGTVFKMDIAGNFTTLHSFDRTDGDAPLGGLIQGSDGKFYGMTYRGGASGNCGTYGCGTVFRIDTSGNLTTIHTFDNTDGSNPDDRLLQASDGNFYGTTEAGGSAGYGTVFTMNSAGNVTTLHSFNSSDGANPFAALIQANDGYLYGTTLDGGPANLGTIYKIDTSGNLTTLHSFINPDGAHPYAGLVQANDGNFYGTTFAGGGPLSVGTIFKMDMAGNLTTPEFFDVTDGAYPIAELIQGSDGNLYGTAWEGGAWGAGTAYRLDTLGHFRRLYSFGINEGLNPQAGLIQASDGNFYGTTEAGTQGKFGTVFRLETSGNVTTVHSFVNTHGAAPLAGLIQGTDGRFFGTTSAGGLSSDGTVFTIDMAGNLTLLHSFNFTDGAAPSAGLIEGSDGYFYGTTEAGGTAGGGTVFKIGSSGNLTVLHSFTHTEASAPTASLVQGSDGNFYGTASLGGAHGYGAVFKMDNAGNLTTLHSFDNTDGANPAAGLIQGTDGNFYGTTLNGGASGGSCSNSGCGTVFKVGTSGNLTVLHFFGGMDGANPSAGLIQRSDGYFYGTTNGGGQMGHGTFFRISSSGNLTSLHSFDESEESISGLIQGNDGYLYGTTSGSYPSNLGTIYKISTTGNLTFLHFFDGADGWYPVAGLALGNDGGLYGTTRRGGIGDAGVVFRLYPCNFPPPVLSASVCLPPGTPGLTASVPANAGNAYVWTITGGTIDSGQGTNAVSFTTGPAGTRMSLEVRESDSSGCFEAATQMMQVDFGDVSAGNPFYNFICTIARHSITAGCGAGNFCPSENVIRSQMALFLLLGEHGSAYLPPPCTGIFSDVACPGEFTNWIEQVYKEGITGGCATNPLQFCPGNPVSRAGMAVFLLAAQHGLGYTPPACTGIFTDVACPGAFTNWVEQLYNEGVTGGCGTNPLIYCPNSSVTRAQMAVFLTATFALQ